MSNEKVPEKRAPSPKKKKKVEEDSDSDEWEREEKKRKQDLEERDEFAKRLKKKDEERTKKKGYQQPDYNEGTYNNNNQCSDLSMRFVDLIECDAT